MYQSLRYPGGVGDMPQTYYFQANSAVFEQGVPRQRVCLHDPGVPYTMGNVYQGQNTNYPPSSSRGPPYGPPSVSQPLLALPPPLSSTTIAHKPEELDDAVVPPARAYSIPPNTDPYPPDPQSRTQARVNNRRATTVASTGETPPPRRGARQTAIPPLFSPRARGEAPRARRVFQSSNLVAPSEMTATPRPVPVEASVDGDIELPPRSPVQTYDPATLPFDDMNDTEMEGDEDDNVVEVTLNMDIPKTTRHADGKPIVTVLNVQSSWHCVFVESIQHERVHTAVRVQYCVSPDCPSKADLVKRLKTVQVIGYESRQVEMSQRIVGEKLLVRGGVTVHLDPALISYNKNASYGFSLSFSSYTLGLTSSTTPDEKLPLQKQQHAAYCRRNLKEMYLDNASKDVAIYIMKPAPRPGIDTESRLGARGVPEHQQQNQGASSSSSIIRPPSRVPSVGPSGTHSSTPATENQTVPNNTTSVTSSVLEVFYAHSVILECYEYFRSRYEIAAIARNQSIAAASASDEGYARPLREQLQQQQQQARGPYSLSGSSNQGSSPSISSAMPPPLQRPQNQQPQTPHHPSTERVQMCLDNVHPNVFRAVLHFMYIGQVPTAVFKGSSATSTITTLGEASQDASSSSITSGGYKDPLDFSWRQIFEASLKFDIKELSHMACLVLATDLRPESVLAELFEWAYQFEKLVPLYVEFVVQHVPRQMLENRQSGRYGQGGRGQVLDFGVGGGGVTEDLPKSPLWQYRGSPAFDRILQEILRVLAMRKPVVSL
ncbi:hypothetical protein BGZ93_009867 [Podila epicladia]|nr:hypothetical protein BGZ93_009867 [Podila epicladia]